MAHPKRVKAIAASGIKTDKIDAAILTQLARVDLLPTAYAPPVEIRELRDLVRHRSKLVRVQTRHKNRIHTILTRYNLHSATNPNIQIQYLLCRLVHVHLNYSSKTHLFVRTSRMKFIVRFLAEFRIAC